jgi:hypothetical protein
MPDEPTILPRCACSVSSQADAITKRDLDPAHDLASAH